MREIIIYAQVYNKRNYYLCVYTEQPVLLKGSFLIFYLKINEKVRINFILFNEIILLK